METHIPTRAEVFNLLKAYNQDENLFKYAPMAKAVMRCFVNKFGEDEENQGIIGSVHDLDYEYERSSNRNWASRRQFQCVNHFG